MLDFITILFNYVNIKAVIIGVAAAQVWNYFCPTKTDGAGSFFTTEGGWRARIAPMIAPVVATLATIILEWDNSFIPEDAAKGVISGFGSEYALRIYYKTIRGL